jgi:type II secretory pathway pseudopilin PulG
MTLQLSIAHNRKGITLMEMLISLGITSMLMLGILSLFIGSSRSSDKIQVQNSVDTDVALAVESITGYLIEGRSIVIDANGLGVTYRRPATNADGTYTSSFTSLEANSHRLYVTNGVLYSSEAVNRPVLRDVPTNDPETGAALRVFSAGVNGKEIVLRLACSRKTSQNQTVNSVVTTHLRPRNM